MSELDALAKQVISLMDLTSLNDDDTNEVIAELCVRAENSVAHTAAVCVGPAFVHIAKQALPSSSVKVATVVNFPAGATNIEQAVAETQTVIAAGADEVDLVYPYQAALNGDFEVGQQMMAAVKAACEGKAVLKVIIESGELKQPDLIRQITKDVIDAGAEFVKTSTGKVPVNATLEAAQIMLEEIAKSERDVGFKAAGGIRTLAQAKEYIELAEQVCGAGWLNADHFRFGASGLLNDVMQHLGEAPSTSNSSGY